MPDRRGRPKVMSMEARTKPNTRARNFNLRAFLAGGGATAALVAAAVLVFASLGAYVAFEGLPVGSGDDEAAQVAVDSSAPAAQVRSARSSATPADGAGRADNGEGAGSRGPGGDTGRGESQATQLGVGPAPAAAGGSGGGSGSGAAGDPAPQPIEPAPEPNPVEPTSGQDGSAPPVPQPLDDAQTALGDAIGIDLPAVTAPIGENLEGTLESLDGTLDEVGSLGEGLTGQLGG